MTHTEMHKLMNDILKEIVQVRDEGQKEYAHNDNDVFANFNRVGHLLEEDRKKVLMTYMLKHVDGIAAYVKGHKSQREDVRGRITDCIVYLMLLWGMIEEEDGDTTRKENHKDVRNVQTTSTKRSVSVDRGRSESYRLQPNGDMQEMRQTGSRLQELEKMETT